MKSVIQAFHLSHQTNGRTYYYELKPLQYLILQAKILPTASLTENSGEHYQAKDIKAT